MDRPLNASMTDTVPNPAIAAAELVISIHNETLEQIANGHAYFDGETDMTEVVRRNAIEGIELSRRIIDTALPRLTREQLSDIMNYTPQDRAGLRTPRPTRSYSATHN